jgi:hypothetical protein
MASPAGRAVHAGAYLALEKAYQRGVSPSELEWQSEPITAEVGCGPFGELGLYPGDEWQD